MNKILIILQREYLTRVRKRTFLLMTFLTPVLFAALFTIPVLLTVGLEGEKIVLLLDETGELKDRIKDAHKIKYSTPSTPIKNIAEAKKIREKGDYHALLYIPKMDWDAPKGVQIHSEKGLSVEVESNINRAVELAIEQYKMKRAGIDQKDLDKIKTKLNIETFKASGSKSSSGGLTMFGLIGAMTIYFAIFLYGSQVMRGVVEEKTSRIIEVIISTVKPFQLMMGKILGVGLVGLTQFILWALLTTAIVNFVIPIFTASLEKPVIAKQKSAPALNKEKTTTEKIATEKAGTEKAPKSNLFDDMFNQINLPSFIFVFLFYFIGGYLMYASMFAAAASAVDNESEMQQFVMPITIPLILAISVSSAILRDPDGVVAFWMSMFPLTSPIIMIVRYPFGVPVWQLALSMAFLVVGFVGMVWLAARIYRVGILMYGKKVNYRELGKWIFYKN